MPNPTTTRKPMARGSLNLSIRLSPDDMAALTKGARKASLPLSAFIREAAVEKARALSAPKVEAA